MKEQKRVNTSRRKYDEKFKQSALKMVENGQSVRSVASSLGVAEGQRA
jgi:transposase-like protein